jgi:hypothetical protein
MTINALPISLIATLSLYEGKPVVATLHDGYEFMSDNAGTLRVTANGVWVAGTGVLIEPDLTIESFHHNMNAQEVRITYAEGYTTILRYSYTQRISRAKLTSLN